MYGTSQVTRWVQKHTKALGIAVWLLLFILVAETLPTFPASNAQDPLFPNQPTQPNTLNGDAAEITSLGFLQTGQIDFSISFNVRNSHALDNFIARSHEQNFGVQPALTEQQFEAYYSPPQADYNRVIAFLSANNLSVTQTFSNRLLLVAEGSVSDVQRAFDTQIGLYSYGNTTFYKSVDDVAVPAALGTCGIAGININSFPMEPSLSRAPEASGVNPSGLTSNQPPSAFRDAYGVTNAIQNGWNGTGTTIAIVDAYGDPTIVSDVAAFNTYYGLPPLSLTIAGTGGSNSGWATETALDVEWAHAMAPGAAIRLQVTPSNSWINLMGAVNTLITLPDPPDVISLSFGGTEFDSYYSYIFTAAVAKGIKVYVSTGDDGAYNKEVSLSVNYPASDPNVIAVGGTTLYSNTVQGTDQYYEYGWSGSGGGYSTIFPEPSYQTNAGIPDQSHRRAIPDVSLNADPYSGVTIFVNGAQDPHTWGGTSLSAPLMAGISAVALNQGLNLDNNAFYGLYSPTDRYNLAFHDVYKSGYNDYHSVHTGWDAVTGLGTINLQNFATTISTSSGLTLTSQSLSTSSVVLGQTFSLNYNVNNPNSTSALTQICLGASIRPHGTLTSTNNTSNDIYVNLQGGSSTQTRQFTTSTSLTPGYYDVLWEVWMGPHGYGNLLCSSGWLSNQVWLADHTITFQTNPTVFAGSAPSIIFNSSPYVNGQGVDCTNADYQITANAPSDYRFVQWSYSGTSTDGVYVAYPTVNSTTVHVAGCGWLKVVYQAKITFQTNFLQGGGTITCNGVGYTNGQTAWVTNLPPDYSNQINVTATPPDGVQFSSWNMTGMLTVDNATSSTTTLAITGPGTLQANFVDTTPPSTPSPDDGESGWHTSNGLIMFWAPCTDAGSGVAGYFWNVDNATDTWTTTTNATLMAQSDGFHTFYVKAQDGAGNNGTYGSRTFQIDGTAPTANAGQSQTTTQGSIVAFDASGSTDTTGVVNYVWDFGDGITGTGRTTTHTYANAGSYVATLTVTDAAGNSATSAVTVFIQPAASTTSTPTPTPTATPNPTPIPSPTATASPSTEPGVITQPSNQTLLLAVVFTAVALAVVGVALTLNGRKKYSKTMNLPPPPPPS